jgi:methanol---5-hydroxybenzimidazolylcobamide Co-methyltransferase
MHMKYTKLTLPNAADLVYGISPHPLKTRLGLEIGGGLVYPELNFTLPNMDIKEATLPEVYRHYRQIARDTLERAAELEAPGVVLEFETLPPMTEHPEVGLEIVNILLEGIQDAHARHGLKGALRCTPNDNREFIRPPLMRSGRYWEAMLELFEKSAAAGAELLSIESVGGKELHDDALVNGDLRAVIFSLCTLGVRDMRFLWGHIAEIASRHGVHAAGDTACGFGNTAMVLAERRMIPRVFAAVVRAVSAVRSLVAYECGAVGPGKDCGYENPILKAITGYPMSMEGKTAACAHLSPMGNLAAATADLWSNESVQNIKLLGGMAPVCYMEQLVYDCRLMNEAAKDGPEARLQLRDWMVRSDAALDPQAMIIAPESAIRLAGAIVGEDTHYAAGKAVARAAIAILREAGAAGSLRIDPKEVPWLDRMEDELDDMPDDEDAFIDEMMQEVDLDVFVPEDYDLPVPAGRPRRQPADAGAPPPCPGCHSA